MGRTARKFATGRHGNSKRATGDRKPQQQAIVKHENRSLATQVSESLERVLIIGDLKELSADQRVEYGRAVAKSLGINILTRPFDYILFREYDGGPERLELYLNARGAAQLRKIHRIGVLPGSLKREIHDEHCIVSVDVRDGWGTTDSATGSVSLFKYKNGNKVTFTGREWDNAIMKCETKAKRRATLSICGLAMLDDSQLDTMQIIGGVTPGGRIWRYDEAAQLPEQAGEERLPSSPHAVLRDKLDAAGLWCHKHDMPCSRCPADEHSDAENEAFGAAEQRAKSSAGATSRAGEKTGHEPPMREHKPAPAEKASDAASEDGGAATTARKEDSPGGTAHGTTTAPPQFLGTIVVDCTEKGDPLVTGYSGQIQGTDKLLYWGEDGFWHTKVGLIDLLRKAVTEQRYEFKLIEKVSSGPSAGGKPAAGKARNQGVGSAPSAGKKLAWWTGIIKQANASTDGKPRVSVLFKTPEAERWITTFDQNLFEYLLSAKAKGKEAVLVIEQRAKEDKTYSNIVGIKRIGNVEFDEEAKKPALSTQREAGTPGKLF
jgi:hypothetical protein